MEQSRSGFVVLNILRFCSVTSLLLDIVAAIVTFVKSFVTTRFFFFDAINFLILSIFCLFLICSELSLFKGYFERNWPLLGPNSSLVTMSILQLYAGINLLGNLNKTSASKENLGAAFNALLLAAGVLACIVGVCNFIISFVYRKSEPKVTARMIRSRKWQAAREDQESGLKKLAFEFTSSSPEISPPYHTPTPSSVSQPERAYSPNSFQLPSPSLPNIRRPMSASSRYTQPSFVPGGQYKSLYA